MAFDPDALHIKMSLDPCKTRLFLRPPVSFNPNCTVPVTGYPDIAFTGFNWFAVPENPFAFFVPVTVNPYEGIPAWRPPVSANENT
jgi:hypothetical protein